MEQKKPLFSVVIPTRNRAHLLRYSLQSALNQQFDDFEIVVSDNGSSPATKQVVDELKDDRVRYVRVEQTLPMPEHWEFASTKATGRYITFLCDDDAFCPDLLSRVAEVINREDASVVVPGGSIYWGNDWYRAEERNTLALNRGSGNTVRCDASLGLKEFFKCKTPSNSPRMLNSFCDMHLLRSLQSKYGQVFRLSPDISFCLFVLTAIKDWMHIDVPLQVFGVTADSIGATSMFNRGRATQQFFSEFSQSKADLLSRAPCKIDTAHNWLAQSVLDIQDAAPDKLATYQLDTVEYLIACWSDLDLLEQNGNDVSQERKELELHQRQYSDELLNKVRAGSTTKNRGIRRAARGLIESCELLKALELAVRPAKRAKLEEMSKGLIGRRSGSIDGFDNILECAQFIAALRFPAEPAACGPKSKTANGEKC